MAPFLIVFITLVTLLTQYRYYSFLAFTFGGRYFLFWQKVPKNHFPDNSACGFTALLKKSGVGKERRRAALPEMASLPFHP